jgi:hypothetical protein
MAGPISHEQVNKLIAQAKDNLSKATGILEDAAYFDAQRGHKPSPEEVTQLVEHIYRWIGKRFTDANPATSEDLALLAKTMHRELCEAMKNAAACFRQLAPVAVQCGQDPRPFTSFDQLVTLNLSGLLKPDPSKVSPEDMFTEKMFQYSMEVCENRLRGADHPYDALLKLEAAINPPTTFKQEIQSKHSDNYNRGTIEKFSHCWAYVRDDPIWSQVAVGLILAVLLSILAWFTPLGPWFLKLLKSLL